MVIIAIHGSANMYIRNQVKLYKLNVPERRNLDLENIKMR